MLKIIIFSSVFLVLLTPISLVLRPISMTSNETLSLISFSIILGIFYSKLDDIYWYLKNK